MNPFEPEFLVAVHCTIAGAQATQDSFVSARPAFMPGALRPRTTEVQLNVPCFGEFAYKLR